MWSRLYHLGCLGLVFTLACTKKSTQHATPTATTTPSTQMPPPVVMNLDFPPYSQRHGNPFLNGMSGVEPTVTHPALAKPIALERPARWQKAWRPDTEADPITELYAAKQGRVLAINPTFHWYVDLATGVTLQCYPESDALDRMASLFPDGRYAVYDVDLELFDGKGEHLMAARGIYFGSIDRKLALVPIGDEFVCASQIFENPEDPRFREVNVFRREISQRLGQGTWLVSHQVESGLSPLLHDGRLVLYLPESLRILELGGGTETGHIDIALVRDLVSVDPTDHIWGISKKEGKLELCRLEVNGKVERSPLSSTALPIQPPITLPNQRVGLVYPGAIELWEKGQKRWAKAFSASNLFALGTPKGELLLRVNDSIVVLDPEGEEKWKLGAPEGKRITSNPVVASDGRVCFVMGTTLECIVEDSTTPSMAPSTNAG